MCKKLICFSRSTSGYIGIAVLLFGFCLPSLGGEDPNLVGWWRFNDGSGTIAADSSGNERHGVLVDGPQWVDGVHGSGLELDGGQHVAVPGYEGILGSHPRSTCAWINVGKTSASIITWGPAGSGTKWIMRTHNGPAALRVECGQSYIYGTTDLVDGEWHHVAGVLEDDGSPDVEEIKLYVDGVVDETGESRARPVNTASGVELRIAYDLNNTGRTYQGLMDDVRIYDRALSAEEIQALIDNPGGTVTQALRPEPADGALYEDSWAILKWLPGDIAVSHDVYMGENFDDVNDGLEGTFQGNVAAASFTIGFPGFAFPDGLFPGTTYYWRVDEVNEAEPDSPWKGKIWSFMVPPKTAYNPIPPDGAKFVDPNGLLSWTAGSKAKLHTVYFGDNFDDVNEAVGGAPQAPASYDPGILEAGKTYYWRVDESDAQTVHRGNVWSFTTTTPGGGLKGEYYNNMTLSGLPILTRIDAGVDFSFGTGSPEAGVVNEDGFSVRWRGEVEAVFSEDYTLYTRTDDGSRLWLNDQLIINKWAWVNTVADARSEPIRLTAGERYSIRMEWYNEDENAEAHLMWESASQPKGAIPAAALSLPVRASGANPSNGAVDVKQIQILKWTAGDEATSHRVYFGTDQEAVGSADTSSPEYKGTRELGSESYDPGKLEWDTDYYWRIDEVNSLNSESPWVGSVWSFRTANFLIIDDFEDYDTGENQIWFAWKDGLGYGMPGVEPYYAGNGTGSAVGVDDTPSYTEESIVHGGRKSMPYYYDNSILRYSEAELTLTYPRDWTEKGVNRLTIWFRGNPDNAAEPMYVVLNGSAVVFHENPNAAQAGTWTEWVIDLQAFADQGVDLGNVNAIGIGFGDRDNPQLGGSGTMYFDDIRLYPPMEPAE